MCVFLCFFVSIKCRHACARGRYTLSHTHTHTASHSQFVLQALFLARGTYIIRVTLGGNKRKGKKHLLHFLYPLSAAFSFCFKHPPPRHSPSLAFHLPSVTFSCLPSLLSSSPIPVYSPRCSLPHYTFDSTSSLPLFLAAPLLVHPCLFPSPVICPPPHPLL